jgi:hypothetical protein
MPNFPRRALSYLTGSIFATQLDRGGTARTAQAFVPRRNKEHAMAFDPGRNPFNPLLIGAIAVVLALAAFLILRDSSGTRQQAGISTAPPPATSPAPNTLPAPGSAPQRSTGKQ